MQELDNILHPHKLGNILIKHNDKWRGDSYLTEDLTFTVDRSLAARFYLLKSGDTTILNGDRISINSGNRTLATSESDTVRLVDRDHAQRFTTTFIVTDGTDNTDPISFETIIFLISDKDRRTALQYEWGIDLISQSSNSSISNAASYKPHDHPNLINGNYGGNSSIHINSFGFLLERADLPITNLNTSRNAVKASDRFGALQNKNTSTKNATEFLDGYRGAIMVILLMIVLILCLIASK